jgi:hypothetical protein
LRIKWAVERAEEPKNLALHRGFVKSPLYMPIHVGCLLSHLIVKIFNNPPI